MTRRLLNLLPVRAIRRYLDNQGPNWGTLIAWNALFAFFPIVLVTITVLGLVLQNPDIKKEIEDQIAAGFPNCRHNPNCEIIGALNSFRERTGVFAIVGFAGLFWSGSALFGAMDQGLSAVYGCKSRDFIPQKLMSFGMILLFTVLTMPLILSGSLLGVLEHLPLVPHVFRTGPVSLLLQIGLGIVDASLLFAAIYYVVPNRRQRLRRVLPGALFAATLFEGFTLLFPLYFKVTGGFATYGQTFALFFLLLFYFFVLGQIVMIGGAFTAELDPDRSACRKIPEEAEAEGRAAPGAYPEGASTGGSTAAASASSASTASRGRPEGTV
jgi:membrane protein